MNINWREVPFMMIIMKCWKDCKAYSHKIDSLNVVCMDMEKKGIPGDSIRKVYASAKEWYGNILKIKK